MKTLISPQGEQYIQELETEYCMLLGSADDAKLFYYVAADRMLCLHRWHELLDIPDYLYRVTNAFGKHVERPIATGDYVHASKSAGQIPEWLYINEVSEFSSDQTQITSVYLHASHNPFERATDSLVLSRSGELIRIYGAPCTEILEKLRWKTIAKAILEYKP